MKSIYEVHQKSIELQERVLTKQKEHLEKQKAQNSKYLYRIPNKQTTILSLAINLALLALCLFLLLCTTHTWIWNLLILDIISIAVNLFMYAKFTK